MSIPSILLFLFVLVFTETCSIDVQPFYERLDDLNRVENIRSVGQLFATKSSSLVWKEQRAPNELTKCTTDLRRLSSRYRQDKWAQTMLDADGKPPSGIFAGKLNWLGDFYECLTVVAPASDGYDSFKGQYCSITAKFNLTDYKVNQSLSVTLGACVPNSCDEDDLRENILLLTNRSAINILHKMSLVSIQCQPDSQPYDAAAIATICVFSFFGLLILAATTTTLIEKILENSKKSKDIPNPINYIILDEDIKTTKQDTDQPEGSLAKDIFKCFCIYTNISKIFTIDVQRGDLQCIHGIRFLSMTWVILGHTYAFAFLRLGGNVNEVLNMINNVLSQAIIQGTFSVDSFFLMSGFLLSYLFLKEASVRDGKISWVYFYVHRYVRLTPVYALVLAFNTSLAIHLGSGPNWPIGVNDPNCRTNWWRNLVYINNFDDEDKQCIAWSWYLSNDMQFYVISPLILYPLWRWPKVGLSMISLMTLASWIATGMLSAQNDLIPGYTTLTQTTDPALYLKRTTDYFNIIYTKPYTRIGPYLIGIALGYLVLHKSQQAKQMSKVTLTVGWSLATVSAVGVVFGFYNYDPSNEVSATYNALSRSLFGGSLAWLIFACLSGNGGIVNSILSWKGLIPLSRLTYCAYLIHPIVIFSFISSLHSSLQITTSVLIMLFFGYLVISYSVALICSASFESSLMKLEKLLLSRTKINEKK